MKKCRHHLFGISKVLALLLFTLLFITTLFLVSSFASDERFPRYEVMALADEPGLGFPYARPALIGGLASFGITPWGEEDEEHFGIDIIPYYDGLPGPTGRTPRKMTVIAPTAGTIRAILAFDSTEIENTDIAVILEINEFWSVILMFEPKSSPGRLVRQQVRSITVKAGQKVMKGDKIGSLIVGEGFGGYPHVHMALLYKNPTVSYFDVLRDIVPVPNLNAETMGIPVSGPGSPWDPVELSLPDSHQAAFFCVYQFSSPRSRRIFEHILDITEYPCGPRLGKCDCICIFDNSCPTEP